MTDCCPLCGFRVFANFENGTLFCSQCGWEAPRPSRLMSWVIGVAAIVLLAALVLSSS